MIDVKHCVLYNSFFDKNVKLKTEIYIFIYMHINLYVSYSWPNGWTELTDIFLGNPWVP